MTVAAQTLLTLPDWRGGRTDPARYRPARHRTGAGGALDAALSALLNALLQGLAMLPEDR